MKIAEIVSEMFDYERETDNDTIIDNYGNSSSNISMPSDVTLDSDSHSEGENDSDNNNKISNNILLPHKTHVHSLLSCFHAILRHMK